MALSAPFRYIRMKDDRAFHSLVSSVRGDLYQLQLTTKCIIQSGKG
jgi:hypothetical protein